MKQVANLARAVVRRVTEGGNQDDRVGPGDAFSDSSSDNSDLEVLSDGLRRLSDAGDKIVRNVNRKKIRQYLTAPNFDPFVRIDFENPSRIIIENIGTELEFHRKHLIKKLNYIAQDEQSKSNVITSICIIDCNDPRGVILQSVAREDSNFVKDIKEIEISKSTIGRVGAKIGHGDDQSSGGSPLCFPGLVKFEIKESTIDVLNIKAPLLKKEGLKVKEQKIGLADIDAQLSLDELIDIMPENFDIKTKARFTENCVTIQSRKRFFNRKLANIKTEIDAEDRLYSGNYEVILKRISDLTLKDCKNYEELAENTARILANVQRIRLFFYGRERSPKTTNDDHAMNFDASMRDIFSLVIELIDPVLASLKAIERNFLSDEQKIILDIVRQIVNIPPSLNNLKDLDQKQISELDKIFIQIARHDKVRYSSHGKQSLITLLTTAQSKIVEFQQQDEKRLEETFENVPLDIQQPLQLSLPEVRNKGLRTSTSSRPAPTLPSLQSVKPVATIQQEKTYEGPPQ